MKLTKRRILLASVLIGVSLFFLFLGLKSNFWQNDDWVYRLNVKSFLEGDYRLHSYVGPTFYMQGFLGAFWSAIFGLSSLDLLTSLITSINVLLFAYLLNKIGVSLAEQLLGILLVAFNPLNVYLSIGFMTGQYFIFFFLVSLILFYKFSKTNKQSYLLGMIIISFLGLLTRQVALIIPLGFALYFAYIKDFRKFLIGLLWFISFYAFLEFIFPKTPRMMEVPLQPQHLLNFKYSFSVIYGILIMLSAFLLPLFLTLVVKVIFNFIQNKSYFILFLYVGFSAILFFGLNNLYIPETVSWGEFPYFENTFERTGFYPRGIHGTKYQLKYNYDLYYFWDLAAKILVAFSLTALLFKIKKLFKFEFFLIIIYLLVLVVTETFYDRYILPLIPLTILFLYKFMRGPEAAEKLEKFLVSCVALPFITFLIFYTYQFSIDFINVNNYVWQKSEELVRTGVSPVKIHGTNAWKLTYRNIKSDYMYLFSYDSPKVNPDLRTLYDLVEAGEIDYPFNFFIDSKVYLYRLR